MFSGGVGSLALNVPRPDQTVPSAPLWLQFALSGGWCTASALCSHCIVRLRGWPTSVSLPACRYRASHAALGPCLADIRGCSFPSVRSLFVGSILTWREGFRNYLLPAFLFSVTLSTRSTVGVGHAISTAIRFHSGTQLLQDPGPLDSSWPLNGKVRLACAIQSVMFLSERQSFLGRKGGKRIQQEGLRWWACEAALRAAPRSSSVSTKEKKDRGAAGPG